MVMADQIALLLLGATALLFVWAAASDIATMTIPNRISILAALAFLPAAFAVGLHWQAILWHVALGALVFGIGFFLFNLGVLGGGDVKLFSAAAVWTGLPAILPFLSVTFIAGGVLAAGMLAMRRFVQPAPHLPAFLNRLSDRSRGVPYAIAIAIGALATGLQWPVALAALG
jgi:prepilin peptidase CpaA